MASQITRQRCLERREIGDTLRVQALEQLREPFLATHTPMRNLLVKRGQIAEPTDEGLFNALRNVPQERSALCMVRGAKGSGKSHLIRWLKYRMDETSGYEPVFLERSDSSLRGMLKQLVKRFGGELASDSLEALRGASERLTERGLAVRLMDDLAFELDPGATMYWVGNEDDRQLATDLRIAALFRHDKVRDILTAESGAKPGYAKRLLDKLSAGAEHRGSGGDPAEEVRFSADDLDAILRITPDQLGKHLAEALNVVRTQPSLRPKVLSLVDACVKPAVQKTLNIARDELPTLFRNFRERLYGKHRLLLLIEDVSVFQGVDDQLLEALLPNEFDPTVAENAPRAPIVSVVGVTDDYYRDFIASRGAFRDRITHEVQLVLTSGPSDPSGSSFEDDAVGFAARYLNLMRHPEGDASLADWARRHDGPAPSACVNCTERAACHAAFGAFESGEGSGEYGLYPFTETGLRNVVRALYDTESEHIEPTPRKLLSFLSNALSLLKDIDRSGFPPPLIASKSLVHPEGAQRIDAGVQHELSRSPNAEELLTLLRWWGDGSNELEVRDGIRRVGGVPEPIFETFGLTFPEHTFDESKGEPGAEEGSSEFPAPPVSESDERVPAEAGGAETPPTPPTPPTSPTSPTPDIERDIEAWGSGTAEALPAASELAKQLLRNGLSGLVWEHEGISHWFGHEQTHSKNWLIAFEGIQRSKSAGAPALTIKKERYHELLAVVQVADGRVSTKTRRLAAELIGWVRDCLISYVRASLPAESGYRAWCPGEAAIRLLYLDFLTGNPGLAITYGSEWASLLDELLREKPTRDVNIAERTVEWKRFRSLFDNRRDVLRDFVRKWFAITQGGSQQSACFDVSSAIDALTGVVGSGGWEQTPASIPRHAPAVLSEISEFEAKALKKLVAVIDAERKHAGELAGRLDTELGSDDVGVLISEFTRLDKAMSKIQGTMCHDVRRFCADAIGRLNEDGKFDADWGTKTQRMLERVTESSDVWQFVDATSDVPWSRTDAVLEFVRWLKQLRTQASTKLTELENGLPQSGATLADTSDSACRSLKALRLSAQTQEEQRA